MDTDEGNPSDPLSLHKYLYTAGNPVNNSDSDGHEIDMVSTLMTAAITVGLFTLAVMQYPTVRNSVANGLAAASNSAANSMATATLALIPLYFSIYDAIDTARAKVKEKVRRLRKKLDNIKIVPISATAMPNIAKHIATAQLGGYPMELNRAAPSQIPINRAAALAGLPPAGPGLSWDEYPFASSVQGGAGSSVYAVPVLEQAAQGGTVAASYYAEKINVGDPYWVVVIP